MSIRVHTEYGIGNEKNHNGSAFNLRDKNICLDSLELFKKNVLN